jgi:hypothetical protein
MSGRSLATLVRNEALIGNFVWGRRKNAKNIITCSPSRRDGCIPRLIDDDAWAQIQRRTALEVSTKQTGEQIVANLNKALQRTPFLISRAQHDHGLPSKATRMEDLSCPNDFYVAPPADVVVRFPRCLIDPIPIELARYWCQSPEQLLERMKTLNERGNATLTSAT